MSHRKARLALLRELQSASGDASQVAPAFRADADIVPEQSEWDVVRVAP